MFYYQEDNNGGKVFTFDISHSYVKCEDPKEIMIPKKLN